VLVSGADLLARARGEAELYGLTAADRLLGLLPFSFDVGLNQLVSSLVAGAELVLSDSWLPADVRETVTARGITGVSAVPFVWEQMLAAGMTLAGAPALRYVTISGGDLSPSGLSRMPEVAAGAGIFKTYGQTETFRSTALLPEEFAARPRSVGRPVEGVRLSLDGGEVVHAGAGTMLGYLGDGGPPPAEVRTGDRGEIDAAGYLTLRGRRDEMVKVRGHRVYPAETAAALHEIPEVREAEVVATGGARLVAFVAGDGLAGTDVRRALSRTLPAWLVPGEVVILSALPRLPNGKPDREALRGRAAEGEPS